MIELVVVSLVLVVTLYCFIRRHVRLKTGELTEGRITYLEGRSSHPGSNPLITFSYTAQGQRFHKTYYETAEGSFLGEAQRLACTYQVGDKVPVWYSTKDPSLCCLGGPPRWWWPSFKTWIAIQLKAIKDSPDL